MALRFITRHRVVICPLEEVTALRVICNNLNLAFTEISRSEGEVMLMMSDSDVDQLREYNAKHNIIPGSWDGEA